jgi:hypothetical protein
MKKSLAWSALGALFLAAALGGCETTDRGDRLPQGAAVTRFHLGQPVARGEIRVEPSSEGAASPEFGQEEAAIGRELARLGWTVLPAKTTTEQVALVRLNQNARPGGGLTTELRVRIQRRSDATVGWEGRAETATRAGAASDRAALVDRLAEALFRDFPGESGRTIRVR